MRSLAVLSLHTSPLAQPGSGDSGGMNVYVRELVSSLAQAGVDCTTYVRRWATGLPDTVEVEPGFRVVHVDAGPIDLPKEALPSVVEEFATGVEADLERRGGASAIHANYWLSGQAGHILKHQLDIPLVSTFHTLARVKAVTGDPEPQARIDAEAAVIRCSDAITASCTAEAEQLVELCGADPDRIELVPPGVEHAFFSPGSRSGARQALGLPRRSPVLLFVGRVQPLKRLDVAIEALARSTHRDAVLVAVGGPSGREGETEAQRCIDLADRLGVTHRIRWVPPEPHHRLSTYYRAADVVLVPSRSESFGLVALEAAACGTPVVAASVGGLRTLVQHGSTGYLVDGGDPARYAAHVDAILDDPLLAGQFSTEAAKHARDFTWSTTAARLRRLHADLVNRTLVTCG